MGRDTTYLLGCTYVHIFTCECVCVFILDVNTQYICEYVCMYVQKHGRGGIHGLVCVDSIMIYKNQLCLVDK